MSSTRIEQSTVLVTGANRGIGRALAEALLERGAAKVYLGSRGTDKVDDLVEHWGDRVVALELDVTNADHIASAVDQARDVDILINNAGVAIGGWLGDADFEKNARTEMEVNYFAPIRLIEGFAPSLGRNGKGAVVNVSSVAGLTNFPALPTYSASKAAVHSLTQAARMLLAPAGITVSGVYPGPVDTDLAKDVPMDKASTTDVAARILDGIEAGEDDIFTDQFATDFADVFLASPKASEQQFAAMLAEMTAVQ